MRVRHPGRRPSAAGSRSRGRGTSAPTVRRAREPRAGSRSSGGPWSAVFPPLLWPSRKWASSRSPRAAGPRPAAAAPAAGRAASSGLRSAGGPRDPRSWKRRWWWRCEPGQTHRFPDCDRRWSVRRHPGQQGERVRAGPARERGRRCAGRRGRGRSGERSSPPGCGRRRGRAGPGRRAPRRSRAPAIGGARRRTAAAARRAGTTHAARARGSRSAPPPSIRPSISASAALEQVARGRPRGPAR